VKTLISNVGIIKLRMIEQVEELGSKMERGVFVNSADSCVLRERRIAL
jgi:hypothetical protein